jgi:predicted Zn-dependent protease
VIRIWCVVATLLLAAGCATNPATGEREFSLMSEAQEIQIGQEQDVQVRQQMGVYDDQPLQSYVANVGLKLAHTSERPNLPWHFTVVDQPAVNAFALPGGYIYITRGILPYLGSEAQLAGVLGHEIGHVTARHAASQYSRQVGAGLGLLIGSILVPEARPFADIGQAGLSVLFLKYSRDDEAQADSLGVRYAARAGWDPEGVPRMLTTLGRIESASDTHGVPNWLATHPPAPDRLSRVQRAVQQAESGPADFVTNRDPYFRQVDGIIYGDDPKQGIVRGSQFLHPDLRLAITFPDGWNVTNTPTQVVAEQPGGGSAMVLQAVQGAGGRAPREVAQTSMRNSGLSLVNGDTATIHGEQAFVGVYSGTLQDLGRVTVRAAHIAHADHIYLVAGIAKVDAYDAVAGAFGTAIDSFRPLNASEVADVHPNRIDLYTARAGDTWQSLAERQSRGVEKAATLAIMNGHDVNDQPAPGERLKIAVPG